jgi:hypothetical protein
MLQVQRKRRIDSKQGNQKNLGTILTTDKLIDKDNNQAKQVMLV